MTHHMRRREFLGAMSTLAAASAFPGGTLFARERLYPPMDLSHFDTPITPAPSEIHYGYAAITWGGNDRQAIDDVAALGFRGIQIRSNAIEEFGSPQLLRDLLAKHNLSFVALSSGGINVDGVETDEIAKHVGHAQFLRDAG